MPAELIAGRPRDRFGRERGGPAVQVRLAEQRRAHPGRLGPPEGDHQRVLVPHRAEHEMGMRGVVADEPGAGGLDGGVDRLDGLLGWREVAADEDIDVAAVGDSGSIAVDSQHD